MVARVGLLVVAGLSGWLAPPAADAAASCPAGVARLGRREAAPEAEAAAPEAAEAGRPRTWRARLGREVPRAARFARDAASKGAAAAARGAKEVHARGSQSLAAAKRRRLEREAEAGALRRPEPEAVGAEEEEAGEVEEEAAGSLFAPPPEEGSRFRGRSFVAEAAARVGPAVVRVDVERRLSSSLDPFGDEEEEDDEEEEAARRRFGPPPGYFPEDEEEDASRSLPSARVEQARASGLVYEADEDRALVLTNAHVVARAKTVQVVLATGERRKAVVLGSDEFTDVAVLSFPRPPRDLATARLGDDSRLRVGDWVVAIGHPMGLDNTVTLGIVSNLGRSLREALAPGRGGGGQRGGGGPSSSNKARRAPPQWGSRVRFIQTDVALNPGNSGGPLCDEEGRVIGINTATALHAEGIGFAIPIGKARDVAASLSLGRAHRHPYVGLEVQALTLDLARELRAIDPTLPADGIIVRAVLPDSPASAAGVEVLDLLRTINGAPVRSVTDVLNAVDAASVGDTLDVAVDRRGNPLHLHVTTAALVAKQQPKAAPSRAYPAAPPPPHDTLDDLLH